MGSCLNPKDKETSNQQQQNQKAQTQQSGVLKSTGTKSWENRKKRDPSELEFKNLDGQTKILDPKHTSLQDSFQFDNCKNSNLFLFGITAQVFVDDCTNCNIFIAPCNTTVFVRNCTNLNLIVACGQYRQINCKNCSLFLFCKSQPAFETSQGIKLGCFNIFYFLLRSQFQNANLNIWSNEWGDVHDFSAQGGNACTFSIMNKEESISEQLKIVKLIEQQNPQFLTQGEIQQHQNFVPNSSFKIDWNKENFLLVFKEENDEAFRQILEFCQSSNIDYIRSKQQVFDEDQLKIIFQENAKNFTVKDQLTGFQFQGSLQVIKPFIEKMKVKPFFVDNQLKSGTMAKMFFENRYKVF